MAGPARRDGHRTTAHTGDFSGRKVNVEIEWASPLSLGMTIVDWWGVSGRTPNVQLLREVNADAYFDLVIGRFARLK